MVGKHRRFIESQFPTAVRAPGIAVQISLTCDSLVSTAASNSGYGAALGVKVQLEIGNINDITLTLNGRGRTFNFAPAVPCSASTRRTTPRNRGCSAACECPTSSLVEFSDFACAKKGGCCYRRWEGPFQPSSLTWTGQRVTTDHYLQFEPGRGANQGFCTRGHLMVPRSLPRIFSPLSQMSVPSVGWGVAFRAD